MTKSFLPDCSSPEDNFSFERWCHSKGLVRVAGCDEAGRGPLAGPVVAGCVILPSDCDTSLFLDSKILTHRKRAQLNTTLQEIGAITGIGIVTEQEIDQINILQASLLAMKRSVENLGKPEPDFILVDGKFTISLPIDQEALIKGESKSGSIAAASILAKVERDRIMEEYHHQFPVYNFLKNKGYPTREHRTAIVTHGICPIHRKTFRGVREHVK